MARVIRAARRWLDQAADAALARLQERADRRWSGHPLCKEPLAPTAEYERRWVEARRRAYPAVDRYEREAGAAIDPE
jgi:hypothetical protein